MTLEHILELDKALSKLLPHQRNDFIEIFKIMSDLPVTVRLLDPPLHEFLPRTEKEINDVANVVGLPLKEIESSVLTPSSSVRVTLLSETSPLSAGMVSGRSVKR